MRQRVASQSTASNANTGMPATGNCAVYRKALEAVLDVARAMGCAHPFMYFEAEGWIHVLDGDHPSVAHSSTERRDSRPAVVFTLHDRTPPGSDVGAW